MIPFLFLFFLLSLTPSLTSSQCVPRNVSTTAFGLTMPNSMTEIGYPSLLQLTNLSLPSSLIQQGGVVTSLGTFIGSSSGGTGSFRLALYRQVAGLLTLVTSTAEVTVGGSAHLQVFHVPATPALLPSHPGPVLVGIWFSNQALAVVTAKPQASHTATVTLNYTYTTTGTFPPVLVNELNAFGPLLFNLQTQFTVGIGCNISSPVASSTAESSPSPLPSRISPSSDGRVSTFSATLSSSPFAVSSASVTSSTGLSSGAVIVLVLAVVCSGFAVLLGG